MFLLINLISLVYAQQYVQQKSLDMSHTIQNGQTFQFYVGDDDTVQSIELYQGIDRIRPLEFSLHQGVKQNYSQYGCYPVDRSVSTQQVFNIAHPQIVGSAIIETLGMVAVTNRSHLFIYSMPYNNVLQMDRSIRKELLDINSEPKLLNVIALNEQYDKWFLLNDDDNLDLIVVGQNTSYKIGYYNLSGRDVDDNLRTVQIKFDQTINKCIYLQTISYLVCISDTRVYYRTFKKSISSETSVIQTNNTKNIDIILKSRGSNSFYLVDGNGGLYLYQMVDKVFMQQSIPFDGSSVKHFANNYNGYVVANSNGVFEVMYQDNKELLINTQQQTNGLYMDDVVKVSLGHNTHQVSLPNQLKQTNISQAYLYHNNITQLYHYRRYGYTPYIISFNLTNIIFNRLLVPNAHVQCYFEDSYEGQYQIIAVSQACQKKKSLAADVKPSALCNISQKINIKSESTVFTSDNKILIVSLSLGIPFTLICLCLIVVGLRLNWNKNIDSIRQHRSSMQNPEFDPIQLNRIESAQLEFNEQEQMKQSI